jgi:hypothetical protein
LRLRDTLEKTQLTLRADRTVPAPFEWAHEPLFVDLDTLAIVRKLPLKEVATILRDAAVSEKELEAVPL